MRAAVIFGLGASPADLKPFQSGSPTRWLQGLPASSGDADAILIFGGDGTIHRHLPALVRLHLPVLIVPAGSGNDFARALDLRSTQDSVRVWRDFEAGKVQAQAVDLGVIVPSASPERPHYFCCVAGCGLDAASARRANQMPRWLRGHGGYALAMLPFLLRLPAFRMRLTRVSDKQVNENDAVEAEKLTLLAAFANTQFYGDGMRIAPQADFADGKLDICRIHKLSPLKLLGMFPTVYFGRHLLLPEVGYSRAERVRVETETPLDLYADGEFVCRTPAEISVAAGALRVIYPAR
ncbi:MAG TPA: diacylglycerol kinase family protein [Terriglobales bacterium]|jgi:diacylglycerol kinase (ATP)|nr:diacylglycerol kinase family protein [Terriglobales bacterium]